MCQRVRVIFASKRDLVPLGEMLDPNILLLFGGGDTQGKKGRKEGEEERKKEEKKSKFS